MDEIINPDKHSAEVAALQHEIYRLNRIIDEKNSEAVKNNTDNIDDPFDNPTEFKGFGGSYAKIQPKLGTAGYRLPLIPDYDERRKLRKFYSIGGWCTIFQFAASNLAAIILMAFIQIALQLLHPEINYDTLYNYMYGSSILVALNMLVYLVCNVANTFIGLKWAGFKGSSLIQTKNFTFGKAVQYCFIATFIWTFSIYAGSFVETILNKFNLTSIIDQTGLGESPLGLALGAVYTCIIAPITEEMIYRGMLLKVFSKANQRFAIFASAFFFGLGHGNLPQFILAFSLGIFLAHITMRHSSIIPSVVVHIFINTLATLIGMLEDKSEFLMEIATLLLFAAAFVGVILLIIFRGDDNTLPSPTPHQSKRGMSVALGSIPFCLAIVIQIINTIFNLIANK